MTAATLAGFDTAITAPWPSQPEESYSLGLRYEALEEQLREAFAEASTSGWDGYDAVPASPDALAYATRFLWLIPSTMPMPEVMVEPDGEISLEWYEAPRWVFSISVGPRGGLTYAGLFGRSKAHGVEQFVDEIPPMVLALLWRFFSKGSA